jgi:hypothetical protein
MKKLKPEQLESLQGGISSHQMNLIFVWLFVWHFKDYCRVEDYFSRMKPGGQNVAGSWQTPG